MDSLMLEAHETTHPRHRLISAIESHGELGDGQANGEEVKGIPGPAHETTAEHEPLVEIQLSQDGIWVSQFMLTSTESSATRSGEAGHGRDRPRTLGGLRLVTREIM